MLKVLITALVFVTLGANARADDLIAVKSTRPVKETLDRLQKLVTDDGFFVVGRVPHSEAAKDAGLTLRPTELMIFGKPQSGTPIMVCNQRAGIDLLCAPLPGKMRLDRFGSAWSTLRRSRTATLSLRNAKARSPP